jgi:putative salt-induced outer membrane protein YdiY
MARTTNFISALMMGVSVLASSFAPANAFSILTAPTPAATSSQGALAAFSESDNGNGAESNLLLSPTEINHIRWCAQRYRSYHPTDDTYAGPTGARMACRSPG